MSWKTPQTRLSVAACVMMAVTTVLLLRFSNGGRLEDPGVDLKEAADMDRFEVVMPEELLGQEFRRLPVHEDELGALPADTCFGKRLYLGKEDFSVAVNVVVMGRDRTSIHKPQYCLTGQGWTITGVQHDDLEIQGLGGKMPIKVLTLSRMAEIEGREVPVSGFFAYWFFEDNKITTSDFGRVTSIAKALVFNGELERWAYTSCLAPCRVGTEKETYEKLKQFIEALVPTFQKATGREES